MVGSACSARRDRHSVKRVPRSCSGCWQLPATRPRRHRRRRWRWPPRPDKLVGRERRPGHLRAWPCAVIPAPARR